jgi:hypothetical protein
MHLFNKSGTLRQYHDPREVYVIRVLFIRGDTYIQYCIKTRLRTLLHMHLRSSMSSLRGVWSATNGEKIISFK